MSWDITKTDIRRKTFGNTSRHTHQQTIFFNRGVRSSLPGDHIPICLFERLKNRRVEVARSSILIIANVIVLTFFIHAHLSPTWRCLGKKGLYHCQPVLSVTWTEFYITYFNRKDTLRSSAKFFTVWKKMKQRTKILRKSRWLIGPYDTANSTQRLANCSSDSWFNESHLNQESDRTHMGALITRKSAQRDSKRDPQGVWVLVYQWLYTVLSRRPTACKKRSRKHRHMRNTLILSITPILQETVLACRKGEWCVREK